MKTTIFFLVLAAYANSSAYGQIQQVIRSDMPKRDSIILSIGKSIADPKSILNITAFLRDETVANELRLDDVQRKEIMALLDETSGQPGGLSMRFGDIKPSRDEARVLFETLRLAREARVRDTLDPLQLERLEQIVRHIEVSRVEFATALLSGFLGQDAGIQEFEKPALTISFDSIQSEFVKAKAIIAKSSQDEILSLLSEDQRKLFPILMGKRFELHETPGEKLRRLAAESTIGIVPDPESFFDSCVLLVNREIVDELGISEEKLAYVVRTRKARHGEKESANDSKLSDLFASSQKERLKQIVYQLEMARRGLGSALAKGFLGRAIGVSESQRPVLIEKATIIDSKSKEVLSKLEDETRKKLMGKLSSAQIQAVTNLLGKPFRRDEKY